MTFEQRERAIGMLTAGMSARDVARHFQRHESTISRLLNRFQQTGNVADRPRSGISRTPETKRPQNYRITLMRVFCDNNQISENVFDFIISYLPFPQKSIRSELAKLFSISIVEIVI